MIVDFKIHLYLKSLRHIYMLYMHKKTGSILHQLPAVPLVGSLLEPPVMVNSMEPVRLRAEPDEAGDVTVSPRAERPQHSAVARRESACMIRRSRREEVCSQLSSVIRLVC